MLRHLEFLIPTTNILSFNQISDSDRDMSRLQHRFLDHERDPDAPQDGKNVTARAIVTPDGYCVEYRDSLFTHF